MDGIIHDDVEQALHDGNRDARLKGYGIAMLHIPAHEVLSDAIRTAEAIIEYARA